MLIQTLFELGWSQYFQSQLDLESLDSELPFRVVSVQRNLVQCVGLDREGTQKTLNLSTYFWREQPPEDHPAIGDWLMLDHEYQPLHILERKSLIKRRGAGREALLQLIAANLDTVFIVTSCNAEFNINRIERYLAIAAESNIHCVLVLTKVDLCVDAEDYGHAVARDLPGLPVEMVNATDKSTLDGLKSWIEAGQTVALLGSSGVGKSTLINGLTGQPDQATAAIREDDSKGRHTTTARSLHFLPGGGILLDNPGMRELQIVDSEQGIKSAFSDIDTLAQGCRFKNCQHAAEPGCAVVEAVAAGSLEQRRLDNYRKLLIEHRRNTESVAQRRHNDRALGRFYKQALKSSRQFKTGE